MDFGFSYIGLIFLLMLMIPNILWSKNIPKDYDTIVKKENKILLIFERIGEVLVVFFSLVFKDFNINELSEKSILLIIAFGFMLLYEMYWIRYFKSKKMVKDMYNSLLGIPLPGAILPVFAFFTLGIYGSNILLIIASVILGIGHIGIHIGHYKEYVYTKKSN